MRDIYHQGGIRVIDDVLGAGDFAALVPWAERATYRSVHNDRWRTVWRLGDGAPLRGPTWMTSSLDDEGGLEAAADPCPAELEPLSALLRRLLLNGARHSARISLTPWIYPQGTALGLHRDDGDLDGSYVFYFSPEWDVSWGGLLHCMIEPAEADLPRRAVFDPAAERASVPPAGPGIWIAPAPNRLVILQAHVRHFISRIDPNAGDRPRLSIAGFIHRRTVG
jgi:hypothetical protein